MREQLPIIANTSQSRARNISPPIRRRPAHRMRRATGFSQYERDATRGAYSFYIPEDYSPDRQLPLIICLHGGYGAGTEYVWTWLRPARSQGCISSRPNRSSKPGHDDAAARDTAIGQADVRRSRRENTRSTASRIYLTGLSDGGIFTYILGLERSELFAGIAPVAGALHMAVDQMLREGRGKDTPIFVIHGVHDFIFPVAFTRQTNELLKQLGYDLKYEELPEWGHAFPYSINERLVLPWFDVPGESPSSARGAEELAACRQILPRAPRIDNRKRGRAAGAGLSSV